MVTKLYGTVPDESVDSQNFVTDQLDFNNYLAGMDVLNQLTQAKLVAAFNQCPSTELDLSGNDHTGTYTGTWAAAQLGREGRARKIDFLGADQYIELGDHADFSFGNGAADSAFSIGFVGTPAAATGDIITKADLTTLPREWEIYYDSNHMVSYLYDNSEGSYIGRASTNQSGKHFYCTTYDASEANTGIHWYTDAVNTDDTLLDVGAYTAMESTAEPMRIGCSFDNVTPANFYSGDLSLLFLTGEELSAAAVRRLYYILKGYYDI